MGYLSDKDGDALKNWLPSHESNKSEVIINKEVISEKDKKEIEKIKKEIEKYTSKLSDSLDLLYSLDPNKETYDKMVYIKSVQKN